MRFGLKFVSIVSIAGVFAWAASAAPLQPSGDAQGPGYGYGGAKVTLCHIPPGNPDNAHTITVGSPAVPAHLAHGDTLGPCPDGPTAAADNGNTGKKSKETAAGTQEKTNNGNGKGKSEQSETTTVESSTTTTEQTNAAPDQQNQKKPKKEKPAQSNGVGQGSAPTTTPEGSSPDSGNGNGNGNGGGNGNAGGTGNGKANGHDK
jgi:hypothetical protein